MAVKAMAEMSMIAKVTHNVVWPKEVMCSNVGWPGGNIETVGDAVADAVEVMEGMEVGVMGGTP